VKTNEKTPFEDKLGYKPHYPHDTIKFIDELWVIMFSDDQHMIEPRRKLVEAYKKLKFLSKGKNIKKLKEKKTKTIE